MNRRLTALFAAFEALLVAAIGIAIPLLACTALWAFHYGLALDWTIFWRAGVDVWLLGHGVDVRFTLDPVTAAALGLPEADAPVLVTIALLGFALLTVLLAARAGRRIGETRTPLLGGIVSLAAFGAFAWLATYSALDPLARPSLWQGALLPTAVFGLGLLIGLRQERGTTLFRGTFERIPEEARVTVGIALRTGAAAATAVIGVAALLATVMIVFSYAQLIQLYEGLHGEVLGGAVVTLGQLALLPNLVVWAASWLIGPGFAIGTGSLVSPLGTRLGPLPALPIFGALPTGEFAFGFIGLAVPIAFGFLAGAVFGPRLRHLRDGAPVVLAGVASGVVGGILLGLVAWASAGSAGPGRLEHVGPDPWAVGICASIELAIACTLGMLASGRRGAENRPRGGR